MTGNAMVVFYFLLSLLNLGRAYDLEDMTCYHKVLQSKGGYEKTLLPYASEVYSMRVLKDGLLPGSQPCSYKRTFGFDEIYAWVNHGCHARFLVCYKLGRNVLVVCSSDEGDYHECSAGDSIIRLEFVQRLLYSDGCVQDKNYGFRENYVWVSNGCKAAFRVTLAHKRNEGHSFELYNQ